MPPNDDPHASDRRLALLRAVVQPSAAVTPPALREGSGADVSEVVPAAPALPSEDGVRQDAAALVGKTLAGKYLLKRMLGEGGMGAVYEGVHTEIGKRVAVKLITNEGDASGEVAARFKREAQAANAARSDHLVEVFDVGRDPKLGLYMVLEFLEGEDLETRLAREGKLDVKLAVNIALQVSRGLAKAHAAGVVHRDLKPANIFLTTREDGTLLAKVVDFGISKFVNEERLKSSWRPPAAEKKKLTRVGGVIGTPQYMSPEQARGLPNVSHRSDVWSLAAVLYESLAGRPAYEEQESYEDMLISIVTTDPPPLTEVAPWVPPSLAAVVHRCFIKDPLTRMADCVALQAALVDAMPDMAADTSNQGLPMSMRGEQLPALPEVKASRALTMSGVSNTQRDSRAPKLPPNQSVLPGSVHMSRRTVRASLGFGIAATIVAALAIGRLSGKSDEHPAYAGPPAAAAPAPPAVNATQVPVATAATPPAAAAPAAPATPPSAAVAATPAPATPTPAPVAAAPAKPSHPKPSHAAAPKPAGAANDTPAPKKKGAVGVSDDY
jgi:serine/threonine-protein kinase